MNIKTNIFCVSAGYECIKIMDKKYKTKKEARCAFESFIIDHGLLSDMSNDRFPTRIYAWKESDTIPSLTLKKRGTFYGFVYTGKTKIKTVNNAYTLKAGQYFCFNDEVEIQGGSGMVIEAINSKALDMVGGPIENQGRLSYLDGCTDSLLVGPVRFGDPCLNAIFLPTGTEQTEHTHPSNRIVMVVQGSGECVIPGGVIPLAPGMIFIIHEESLHKIRVLGDQSMILIAYHPDSDCGPKDDDHPMINRTIIKGVSASTCSAIHTKES